MKGDLKMHHRRSIRLKGYDYSQPGFYFVTLCCQNHEHFFGEIIDDAMMLNDAGRMVEKGFYELMNKFTDIQCDEMVVMPNHIHFIVNNVGADLRVCPSKMGEHTGSPLQVCPSKMGEHTGSPLQVCPSKMGEHIGSPLRSVVQWFKTMTTNEYIRGVKNDGWRRFDGKLWQRNYWEHIVRDEESLEKIRNYIINNPTQWVEDENNILQFDKYEKQSCRRKPANKEIL